MIDSQTEFGWKQTTPQDQKTAILSSLEGHLHNYMGQVIDFEKFKQHNKEHLQQLEALQPFLQKWKPQKWVQE